MADQEISVAEKAWLTTSGKLGELEHSMLGMKYEDLMIVGGEGGG